ncbi:DMT family transporter [Bartonella sp. DGB2]|uniref:DMT family transporter n=1 Tax=Bartonella sp. DGB2 TaxID=3388426 RepID=UPI00398FACC9
MMKDSKLGLIEMVSAMILMGTVGYFVIESGQTAYNVVFFRCLFGAICLSLYCYFTGNFKKGMLNKATFIKISLSGIFLILNWILLFASFKRSSISTSTVVYHIQPFFFIIIWAFIMKEKISIIKLFWMLIAFVGLVLISNIERLDFSIYSSYLQGILLALSAALFWAISTAMVKKYHMLSHIS